MFIALMLPPVVAVIWLVTVIWGWLFPEEPPLDRLAEDEVPAWVIGAVPPSNATASVDAPEGWRLVAGSSEASPPGEPLEQTWRYGERFETVQVEVTLIEGLADAPDWPDSSRRLGGDWEPVSFYELDAYTQPESDLTDAPPGHELLIRVHNWEIWLYDVGAEAELLMAMAERIVFDPPERGDLGVLE